VLSLRKRNLPVAVVRDAIKSISKEEGRQAVAEMVAAGAQLVTMVEVCGPRVNG
jgi:nicotinamidase-related amidase